MFNTTNNDINNDLTAQQLTQADIHLISGGATPEQVLACMDPKSSDAQIHQCLTNLK